MNDSHLSPLNIPAILKQFDIKPKKRLGQNFLVDDMSLQAIIKAAEINQNDRILEIGAGLGNLTRLLSLNAYEVTAVELDKSLFHILTKVMADFGNVRLIQGDILKLDPVTIIDGPNFVVVANIPYYITSAIFRHLLEYEKRPRRIILTVQEEVATRICSMQGNMNLLALSVQVYGRPEIVSSIPADAFYPKPKVNSAILRVDIYPEPLIPLPYLDSFFRVVKAGFSQKRKKIRNSLSAGLGVSLSEVETRFSATGIDPNKRAETISIDEWGRLARNYLEKSFSLS
jgi:16S rRNA (adenine1518-N6/adenine1519-N6)-dimethyltransferase